MGTTSSKETIPDTDLRHKVSGGAVQRQTEEKLERMILSPASEKWRGAYYACHICKQNADFICPRGLTPICTNCKARYVGIFGNEAFEIMGEEKKR